MSNGHEQRQSVLISWADTILDRAVLPGYSRLGPALRRHWWAPDPRPGALSGKTAVVTGASSGIGAATATALAGLGAQVVLVVRDRDRGEQIRGRIVARSGAASAQLVTIDLAAPMSVHAGAEQIARITDRVDVLVHCAGVLPERRIVTAQGDELTLATHVLGPTLLTDRFAPLLSRAGRSRIVFVSSGGAYTVGLHAQDPQFTAGRYRGAAAYARTKRMQIALAPVWAQRWGALGARVAVMHPGWVHTPGIVAALPRFHRIMGRLLRTPDQGADTIVWLSATGASWPTGRLWHDRRIRPSHYLPWTAARDARVDELWAYCVERLARWAQGRAD